MIEVLVTVVVMGIGLLGIMKMEATALSSTASARMRALVALQARSLAAAMRGNPAFWADPAQVAAWFRAQGTTPTWSAAGGVANVDCTTKACTPAELAAFDLRRWANDMAQHVPSYAADGRCTALAGTPVRCRLQLSWKEKLLGVNGGAAGTASDANTHTYVLLIEP